MTLEKHNLVQEFPEFKQRIHELKLNDNHFARLFAEYHDVDHEVFRIEQGTEVSSDDYLEERKKLRLHLKDQIFTALQA